MAKKLLSCLLLLGLALSVVLITPVETSAAGSRKTASKRSVKKKSGKRSTKVKRGSRKSGRVKQARRGRGRRNAMMSANGRYGRRTAGYRRISGPASAMPADRVREIQDALKQEGFFEGEPTGQYDKATVDAMKEYQKSRNFRATGYPTAEALQSLRLTKNRSAVAPSASSASGESETQTQTKSQLQVPPPEAERNNR